LDQGPTEKTILTRCIRENLPYPQAIANAPELEFGNAFYYVAFNDLASCRLFENGMIPWTAIQSYANENDIHGDQREMLFEVMREMDSWYMDRQAAKVKKENKSGKGKPKGKGIGK
jgi:hypothetical protein